MEEKGTVCVTGGTGFVASWLIKSLLEHGYSVNSTVRPHASGSKKDISFLTNLPSAPQKLRFFEGDLSCPDSFRSAIEGCVGVFHVAHPMEFDGQQTEQSITELSVRATLGILQASLDSKTVRRVVYTSSASTVVAARELGSGSLVDEGFWSDVDFVRSSGGYGSSYCVSKTLTERAALDFGEKHGLEVVSVVPSWIHGPFVCPDLPGSVKSSLAVFMGNEGAFKYHESTPFVHTDDVARAHIFLFEHPKAKGRYICSAVQVTFDELWELVSKKYPEFQTQRRESLVNLSSNVAILSSKKLLDAGFRYKYGIEEMFDDAIECCKQRGLL